MSREVDPAILSLRRAVEEHNRNFPKSPLKVGRCVPEPYNAGVVLQLLVMRPCGCGHHVASALFRGWTEVDAAREARKFVEALSPPDEP